MPAGLAPAPPDPVALLAAVDRGWPCFPLRPSAKLPAVDRWEQRAIRDPARVRAFLAQHPRANLGVACGPAGLLVVDCDAGKGDPPPEWALPGIRDGADVLMELAERLGGPRWFDVVDTFTVSTPSGGSHYYFGVQESVTLRNTAGKLGWCVDTRASGGYVVAPGSMVDGRPYTVLHDGAVRPAPSWLVRLLTERPTTGRDLFGHCRNKSNPTAYGEAALRAEVARVLEAPVGQRNTTLNTAAYSLGQLVGRGDLNRSAVLSALLLAGQHIGLGDAEAHKTVSSGLRSGIERPRVVA